MAGWLGGSTTNSGSNGDFPAAHVRDGVPDQGAPAVPPVGGPGGGAGPPRGGAGG